MATAGRWGGVNAVITQTFLFAFGYLVSFLVSVAGLGGWLRLALPAGLMQKRNYVMKRLKIFLKIAQIRAFGCWVTG